MGNAATHARQIAALLGTDTRGRELRRATARRLSPRTILEQVRRAIRMRQPVTASPARRVLFPLPSAAANGGWTFHDEHWIRVVHRTEHRRLLAEGRALTVQDHEQTPPPEVHCGADGSVRATLAAADRQLWVWLHLDPAEHSWTDFRWEFTVCRDSSFRELQFGFRYVDFYNRYRFRHEDDHWHFDIVVNGGFRNSLYKVPFVMEPGHPYRCDIDVCGFRFVLRVDGRKILDEVDRDRLFPRGSIAVIFWEDDRQTPILASVTDALVVET